MARRRSDDETEVEAVEPLTSMPTSPDAFSSFPMLITSGIGLDPVTGDIWQFQKGAMVKLGTVTP